MATAFGGSDPPKNNQKMKNVEESNDTQEVSPKKMNYANLLKPKCSTCNVERVAPKSLMMIHGEPNITWKSSEVKSYIQENLQYAIIKPDIMEWKSYSKLV